MVTVKVKLFGTLGGHLDGYDFTKGLEMKIPDSTDIGKLLELIGLAKSRVGLISVNGLRISANYQIGKNDEIRLFQPLFGG
jgi:sulfur carrier protein ThiS